jgi:glycosyltransferase involved in cell wall biosynthesis
MTAILKTTCIIPCHNAEKTIERAVTSALAAGVDMVLVYDDFSTDGSLRAAGQRPRVCLLNSITDVPMGVNGARNYLCTLAEDGLIIPLDADDELRDISALKAAYEPGTWVYGDYVEHDGPQERLVKGCPAGTLARKNITGVTFAFSSHDWFKVGGYDPDFAYAEDYAFQCALTHAGIRPKYVETTVYDRYLHPNGNERTAKATAYWTFYHDLARSKYPAAFGSVR